MSADPLTAILLLLWNCHSASTTITVTVTATATVSVGIREGTAKFGLDG